MKNRMIVDGHDLFTEFGLVMGDDMSLRPPAVKENLLENPGGDGPIDFTEATGTVLFERREQEFLFGVVNPADFEATKSAVMSFLHGRWHDYELTFDHGYTYSGRFFVDEHYSKIHFGFIRVTVSANPYKSGGLVTHEADAQAGVTVHLQPGRGRVRPVIESQMPCHVICNGVDVVLPAGSHTAIGLYVERGASDMYLNTGGYGNGGNTTWADVDALKNSDIDALAWYQLMWLNGNPSDNPAYHVRVSYEIKEL